MSLTPPGNDDDTGENHQLTLRKNTVEPVEQTLKQNSGRYRAQRSRSGLLEQIHRQMVSGHTRMSASSGHRTRSLPLMSSGDQPRLSHSATCTHRRPCDSRQGFRDLDFLRSALCYAGPAMQQRLVHGPAFSLFGRCGQYDSLLLDGNHVLCLISRLMLDGLRPSIASIPHMSAPLPISIWMIRRPFSDRCEYASPIGVTFLRTDLLGNFQSGGCYTFIQTTGMIRANCVRQRMSFVTRPILCGGVGCGFEMRGQLPLALDSFVRTSTAKAGCLAQWLGDTVGPTEVVTDSTSKVVGDSHTEDCKTRLFISGGTSGSDVPPLFSGEEGAVNITKTKEYTLAQAHIAALLYHERFEGRSIKIHCEDDLTLATAWDSRNFAHLRGLDYYLDDSKRCRLPPRKLYEDLLRGRRTPSKRVSLHGDVQWLEKKADVLTDAMDTLKVTHVVVSGNSRTVLHAGNEVWCIGLGRTRDGRHYPQSSVKKSFDEVRKTGTATHIVAAVEMTGLQPE